MAHIRLKTNRQFLSILAIGALFTFSTPASAQSAFDGFASSMAMNQMHAANREIMMGASKNTTPNKANRNNDQLSFNDQALRAQQDQSLDFIISQSRRKANMNSFIAKTRKVDPSGAADLERIFNSVDIMKAVEKEIRPSGLSIDNLADAFATYWITAYDGSRGVSRDFTRNLVDPVKGQAAIAILATPEINSATDAEKQELAEAYFIQAVLIGSYIEATENDPQQREKVKVAIKKGAKASGLDLDMMVLTDEGFKPRKGSDASDAVPPGPGEEAEAIADAGVATDDTTTYALIAAAGAGTLAAAFGLGKVMGRRG